MKIRINTPEKVFFTSDTHFGHKNVLSLTNRPFRDLKEHDEVLVQNWNEVIPKDGIVIHQGDFSLGLKSTKLKWLLETLNYDKIYLVQGNHEKDIMKKHWAKQYFEVIAQRIEFEIEDINGKFKDVKGKRFNVIIADHYPMLSWNKSFHGSYHTYGHTHGNLKNHPSKKAYEVGVDTNYYKPISYSDLMKIFNPPPIITPKIEIEEPIVIKDGKDTIIRSVLDYNNKGVYGEYLGVINGFSLCRMSIDKLKKCTVNYNEFKEEIEKLKKTFEETNNI